MDKVETIYMVGDLLKVARSIDQTFGGRSWWRGQPADRPLVPKVYRDGATHQMEWLRATQFRQKAVPRHSAVPGDDDPVGWLFLMQHYGLPTRLLDWTQSPLIACFFAVQQHDDLDACLWALDPEYLNAFQLGEPGLAHPDSFRGYFEAVFQKVERPPVPPFQKVIALLTTETNVRMLEQQSVFTIHGSNIPIEQLEDNSNFLASYRIPAEAKKDLWKDLIRLGIRESSLFPDLDHLAKDLCQTVGGVS